MRNRFLVAYDIRDSKRLRQVYKAMHDFGSPLQYSVFQCDLSDIEKTRMMDEMRDLIHHDEDRVMVVDIGPLEGRAASAFEFIGETSRLPDEPGPTII